MEEGGVLFIILLMDANGCEIQVLTLESTSVMGRIFKLSVLPAFQRKSFLPPFRAYGPLLAHSKYVKLRM